MGMGFSPQVPQFIDFHPKRELRQRQTQTHSFNSLAIGLWP